MMRLDSTLRALITRAGSTLVLAVFVASCAETTATPRDLALQPSFNEASATDDVIINDEVWIDRTVEETPVEMPTRDWGPAELTPSFSTTAANAPAEPVIRVGVVYAELSSMAVRISGRDANDTYQLRSAAGDLLADNLSGEHVAAIVGSGAAARISIPLGTKTISSPGPVVLVSTSGFVRIRRLITDPWTVYRGTGEVGFNSTRTRLVGINQLPIEQYIKGVVPRELGPIAFPEIEALKAQAVAARTFARRRMQFCGAARCGHGYHVIPTTSDQVYGGFSAEHPLSTQAVDDTRGFVGTYNGALIEGLYSSTSGGWTANSEDVFLNALPYLRGVPDHERGKALEHVPSLEVFRNHANPTNLRNHANGDYEADWSIFHRWYVHWTKEEMRQVVGRIQLPSGVTFIDPGVVYAIDVASRSSSGRVFEMKFVTEKRGTLTARKDAVRTALRYVTYNAARQMVFNSLRSTLVFVQPEIDPKTKALVGWEAWGGGWGHGTGMSQTGAVGMAEKGHNWEEILGHYYQGVVLEKRW